MATKTNFETSMKRLEEIVRKLEEEQVPLEESMRLYEEGMKLGRRCRRMLDEADERIRKLAELKDGECDDDE
ncbi:MAG: exodeoxyribonuclease VII small subunit [Candidatus Krumholzibacteria bacterium]|nr:exodeoxyribonuclease VII small subunit [Candidatus Krumholzibacteria bacterium]